MQNERQAPVNEGQEYEVVIESVGDKGDGIAKVKGFVLFVPGVKKGDYVKVRVTKVLANVGFAEVVKKLEGKPVRKHNKFVEVNPEEFEEEPEVDSRYEDTDDFGEELVEE
ncbi:TRAM domain-containing protein [Candidatus Woesearchaeota archaeon]|nr:TRAM domain-containing protein [Candidatus Woesearchaeota archaeon]